MTWIIYYLLIRAIVEPEPEPDMIALLPNCGFLSETSRMLHIAQALQARGEPVCLATHGGPYLRVLDDAGMPYTLLSPVMDAARSARYLKDLIQIGRPGVRLQPPDEVRQGVQAEVDFFRATGAEMAVIGFTLTAYLSSRVVGIPLAASHGGSWLPPLMERGLAPVPTTMPIPGTEWLPDWLKRKLANGSGSRMKDPVKFLNIVAAELGVAPVPTLAALMLGDLTLVTDLPEILGVSAQDLQAWRPPRPGAYRDGTRLVCVGPLFARLDMPVPATVQPFLDGSRPTAFVVLSSSTPQALRTVTARVRATGLRVIVGATIHDFGPSSDPDIVVAGILPSHRIMPKVDLAVTMGGQGSVQTAMSSGTPLVGIPLHPEQELNVDLAARQGMAIAVAPRHAGTERMTAAVSRLLVEPGFRQQARRVQALYANSDGADRAALEILRHVQPHRRRASAAAVDLRAA
ncbi:glycosyltransferase [Aquabacterium sp.]|uniref:glycosyltransferase n=1 Tax=Aquabacterium sp. TaxID=1872578 RepID=UPI002BFB514C|nr:nucleotide disphospho-sugar-binding domain-containing protein [Aquabacterium sp.]HSW06801.1 nucleotide disphospho-sugar-binding domain-containing protein [Aquabacterium sp.]